MLRLITDAPVFVVRDALALVPGATYMDAGWDTPGWASTEILAMPSAALAMALGRLGAFRFAPHRPRTVNASAIGDPTYAIAASIIERGSNGGSSAPAIAR